MNIIRYYELFIYVSEIVSVGRFLEGKRLVTGKEVSRFFVTENEAWCRNAVWRHGVLVLSSIVMLCDCM